MTEPNYETKLQELERASRLEEVGAPMRIGSPVDINHLKVTLGGRVFDRAVCAWERVLGPPGGLKDMSPLLTGGPYRFVTFAIPVDDQQHDSGSPPPFQEPPPR